MAALFLNAGFAQHQNAVSVFDGGQAVGNRQRGAALGQLIQALPNQNLTLVVQRACGFVQQQDGRVLQKYPRNADALFLPAGKLDSAFAYIGIIPVFQLPHKAISTGQPGGGNDLLPRGTRLAVSDVFGHRAAEQVNILLHHANGIAQAAQGNMADVLPVNQNLAAGHIIKARDQVAQGGFSAAGRPNQRQILAGADVQVYMTQHLVVVVRVFKAHIAELNAAFFHLQRFGVGGVSDLNGGIDNVKKALNAGHAALELLGKLHNAADGGNQSGNIQHIGNQIASADGAIYQRKAACHNDHQIHQPVKQPGGGVERGHGMVGFLLDGLERGVALLELFVLFLFRGERLHNPLAQQAVLNRSVQLADLEPLAAERGAKLQVQLDGYNRHQGHAGKHHQSQRYAGPAQDDERSRNFDARNKKFFRAVVGEFGHIKQVVGNAAHDLPNFGIGIIGVAQPLQVGKGIPPHIGLNVNAHDVAGAGHKILCGTINQPQNEIQQGEL